jgi:hypothetical protein
MKKLLHLIVRYKEVSISTIFVEPIVTEEWTILNTFKFKIPRKVKSLQCDHSHYLGIR